MDLHYRKIDEGYQLYDGAEPRTPVLPEIAIALDKSSGTLHKHGACENVSNWYAATRGRLLIAGLTEMANDLVMVSGRFDVEELNRCLSTSGYAGRFFARLSAEVPEK